MTGVGAMNRPAHIDKLYRHQELRSGLPGRGLSSQFSKAVSGRVRSSG